MCDTRMPFCYLARPATPETAGLHLYQRDALAFVVGMPFWPVEWRGHESTHMTVGINVPHANHKGKRITLA